MKPRAFQDERPTRARRSPPRTHGALRPALRRGPAILAAVAATGITIDVLASEDLRATAGLAVARDSTGQKAAATATALLGQKIRAAPRLRRVDPAKVLSGDPRTKQEEVLQRARTALEDGRRSYDSLALEDAIARLGQAVSLYQRAGPNLLDLGELATALTYLGASLVLRGSAAEGERTFVELLTIHPNHQLADFPPAITRTFERAARAVDRVASGSVEVYSTPPYAAVFIDGRYEGVTPLVIEDLASGTHYVRLEKFGYVPRGTPLQVAPGQQVTSQTRLRDVRRGIELRDLTERTAPEVDQPKMGGALRALARVLVADTLIVIAVSQSGRDASFTAGVFDGASDTRIATRRVVLAVDHPNFRRDLDRYLDALIAAAAGRRGGRPPVERGPPPSLGGNTEGAFGRSSTNGRSPEADDVRFPKTDDDAGPGAPKRRSRQTPTGAYVGWSLAGAGTAALITGGVFGGLALSSHLEFNDTPQNSPDLRDVQDSGNREALIADVLYGVGGAMLAGGIATLLWVYLADPSPGQVFEIEQAGLTPTEDGAVVSLGGRF